MDIQIPHKVLNRHFLKYKLMLKIS